MEVIIGIIAIIVTVVGIIIGLPPFIRYVNDNFNYNKTLSIQFRKYSTVKKIISYIWYFPMEKRQESWAIKESQVFLGNLEKAKQNPGLGIAILSVEFALNFFGEIANERIDDCINWGIIRTQKSKPFFVQVKYTDERTTNIKHVPDFRHTIALGIILSKTNKYPSHLDEYLKFIITNQHEDGGWSAGQGLTASELFSCLYAIELLMLNRENPIIIKKVDASIQKATNWLIKEQSEYNLWRSGVFPDYYWDIFFASTWILNRLVPLNLDKYNNNWRQVVIKTSLSILSKYQTINWQKIENLERFRIDASVSLI
jgi:hypothetical protein